MKEIAVSTLLNSAAATTAVAGTVLDLAPSPSVGRRSVKVIVQSSGCTYTTATLAFYPIALEECATTNGTFSTMVGDSVTNVGTVAAVTGYHVYPSKRYIRASITTVGTGGTSCNISVLLLSLKRRDTD